MYQLDDGVGRCRQEAIDQMRAGNRFRLGATVALELGPDASEGRKRPVVIQREPDDILFLSDAEAREAAARVLEIDPSFTNRLGSLGASYQKVRS